MSLDPKSPGIHLPQLSVSPSRQFHNFPKRYCHLELSVQTCEPMKEVVQYVLYVENVLLDQYMFKGHMRASWTVQWVRTLATKPGELSLILSSH